MFGRACHRKRIEAVSEMNAPSPGAATEPAAPFLAPQPVVVMLDVVTEDQVDWDGCMSEASFLLEHRWKADTPAKREQILRNLEGFIVMARESERQQEISLLIDGHHD